MKLAAADYPKTWPAVAGFVLAHPRTWCILIALVVAWKCGGLREFVRGNSPAGVALEASAFASHSHSSENPQ